MNKEFEVHILSQDGINTALLIATLFDEFLDELKKLVPESRELLIVKTKLEEASFFAKKGMACANVR